MKVVSVSRLFQTVSRSLSMAARNINLGGIFPPIVTPFNKDESISYENLKFNLQKWNKFPFTGYVVLGTNGEFMYMSAEEKVEIVRWMKKNIPKDKLLIAGAGCESTRQTVELSRVLADAGADALLVLTPFFYKNGMTNNALIEHYSKVADSSSVPVILYSVPANTGIDLNPDVIIKLSSHPNIIGFKDSGGDVSKLSNLVHKTKANNFQILAGSAGFLYPALVVGCVGGVCALANVLGKEVCDLYELFVQGNHSDGSVLQQRLSLPNTAVTRQLGVPALKLSMEWFGFYGGRTRLPLLPLTANEQTSLRNAFAASNFLNA